MTKNEQNNNKIWTSHTLTIKNTTILETGALTLIIIKVKEN